MPGGGALFVEGVKTINLVFLAADTQHRPAAEAVHKMIAFL
jgi:hypothetical protein